MKFIVNKKEILSNTKANSSLFINFNNKNAPLGGEKGAVTKRRFLVGQVK